MKEKHVGLNFSQVLLIAFIVLKLCHVIDWSWWWVMSPLWGAFVLMVIVAILGALARD